MSAPRQILIVGGGFTGLTAALRLSANPNHAVTVVESAPQLGGLAAGFPLAGTWLEKTYHHLFLTDTAILDLVRELGVQEQLLWCDSSVGIYRDGRVHAFKTPLDLLRFAPCNLPGRVRTGAAALYLKHLKNWRGLAGVTALDWMTRACGPSAMATIWTPLLKGKFDQYYDQVSMAWFWARIHTRANSRSAGGGEKLGYFRGGFNVVTSALEQELRRRGVTLRTGTAVESIGTDRTATVAGARLAFDQCVFTGPSPALARLLPPKPELKAYAGRLQSIAYLGAICLVFTSAQNLGDYYWLNVNAPDAPFLVFINHTRLVPPAAYGGRHVYYIGAYLDPAGATFGLSDTDLCAKWFAYLKTMFPAFVREQVADQQVFRFRAAQHIVDTRYAEKMPTYQTPVPGVWLANFSQIFPEDRGTNFAVREGVKIAALVAETMAGKNPWPSARQG